MSVTTSISNYNLITRCLFGNLNLLSYLNRRRELLEMAEQRGLSTAKVTFHRHLKTVTDKLTSHFSDQYSLIQQQDTPIVVANIPHWTMTFKHQFID